MTRSIINIADMDCTKTSPCKNCLWHIQGIEKNRCVRICKRLEAYRNGLEYDHLPWPELKDLQDAETEDKIPPKNINLKAKSGHTGQKKEKIGDSMPEIEKTPVKQNDDDIDKNQISICLAPGCNKPVKIRNLCQTDYDRWRNGTIDHPELGQYKKSNKMVEKGICLIEGCNEIAKVRGLCHSHYQAFRKGTIEHPTQGKFAVSQVHYNSKVKTATIKKVYVDPLIPKPKKSKEPYRDKVFKLYMTKYPEIMQYITETAEKSLLPAKDVFIQLLSEAIIARKKEQIDGVK